MNLSSKYNSEETTKYWLDLHKKESNSLIAVCFPGHTLYLNRCFDEFQKFAIRRALMFMNISLKGKNVLDIGCGGGRWLRFYESLGAKSIGLDISEEAVNRCKRKGLQAVIGNCTHLPFEDSSFDIVSSITVLHHLTFKEQKKAAKEIMRVLKPDGILILLECTYNDPSPHMFCRSVNSWYDLFDKTNMIFAEAHYYCPLIRLFWKIPILRRIPFIENLVVALQKPFEYLFLKKNFNKLNTKALQHLMILTSNKK